MQLTNPAPSVFDFTYRRLPNTLKNADQGNMKAWNKDIGINNVEHNH